MGFQVASNEDSEFESGDDQIEDNEEFGGASRAVKLSIRAFQFNTMLSEKNNSACYKPRVSLLSRASNYVQGVAGFCSDNKKKLYDRSSKLLNIYIQKSSARDSSAWMAGIDEREEFQHEARPSNVANKYNFQSFYTPAQTRKKLPINETTYSNKKPYATTAATKKYKYGVNSSIIIEQDLEESQQIKESIRVSIGVKSEHSGFTDQDAPDEGYSVGDDQGRISMQLQGQHQKKVSQHYGPSFQLNMGTDGEEVTEQRFVGETGASLPTSFVNNIPNLHLKT